MPVSNFHEKLVPFSRLFKLVDATGGHSVILAMNEKPGLVAVPLEAETIILPEFAPAGTKAVIRLGESTYTESALTLPIFTVACSIKFKPVIKIFLPARADVGVNYEITGTGMQ